MKIAASPAAAQPGPTNSGAHDAQSIETFTRAPSGSTSSRSVAPRTIDATSGQSWSISQNSSSGFTRLSWSLKRSRWVTAPTLMQSAPIGKYQIQPVATAAMNTVVRSRWPL